MLGTLPLLAIVVIAYNAIVFMTGPALDAHLISVTLISGAVLDINVGEALLTFGLVLLFLELVGATRTSSSSIINHGLSMVVFIVCLIEFVVLPEFGTSTFFFLTLFTLLDVVGGYTISFMTARRDFSVGG